MEIINEEGKKNLIQTKKSCLEKFFFGLKMRKFFDRFEWHFQSGESDDWRRARWCAFNYFWHVFGGILKEIMQLRIGGIGRVSTGMSGSHFGIKICDKLWI